MPRPTRGRQEPYPYGAITRYGPTFQTVPVQLIGATGLVRVRSPLLTESRLMSFPPATEMVQFAGFASHGYVFTMRYRLRGGLPHSEILGSTPARSSPRLIAACYVLHRLSVPRHPPNALEALASTLAEPPPTGSCPRTRMLRKVPSQPDASAGRDHTTLFTMSKNGSDARKYTTVSNVCLLATDI